MGILDGQPRRTDAEALAEGLDAEFSELRVGLDHPSLAVDSDEELERWFAHLDECAVQCSPINHMPHGSVVVFRDPDNIQLELFARFGFPLVISRPSRSVLAESWRWLR